MEIFIDLQADILIPGQGNIFKTLGVRLTENKSVIRQLSLAFTNGDTLP